MQMLSTSARMLLASLLVALVGVAVMTSPLASGNRTVAAAQNAKGPQLAHMVYFELKESNAENRAKLVAACDKYLSDHPGTVYYSAGVLCDQIDRPVNVRDWDVALHLVFENIEAHDTYQTAEKHVQFVNECKPLWKSVRVFDANVTPVGK